MLMSFMLSIVFNAPTHSSSYWFNIISSFIDIPYIDLILNLSIVFVLRICFRRGISSKRFIFYYLASCLNTIRTTALRYDNWTIHSTDLLRTISSTSVGYDPQNHTIWLLGGYYDRTQLISFNYVQNIFSDYGAAYLPRDVFGRGQNYVQIGTILYMLDPYESYINSFNMRTMTFVYNYTATLLSFDGEKSCLVNIRNTYFAVLGIDTVVQILNITSQLWLYGVPSLQIDRKHSSCIHVNDKTFIVAGWSTVNGYLSSIEYLDTSSAAMNNIGSMSWEYTLESLPYGIGYSRCITVNDDILVIGGYNRSIVKLDTVYIINSIALSVSLGGYLVKGVADASPIIVSNSMYCFGGTGADYEWQTLSMIPMTLATTKPSNVPYSTSGNSGNTITVSETIMTKTSEDRVDSTTTQISTNYAPSSTSTPLRTSPDIQSTATQYQTQSDDLDEPEVIDNDDKNVAIILISSAVSLVAIIGAIIWYWIQRRKWKKELQQMRNNAQNQDNVAPPQLLHGVIGIKGGEDDHEMDERKETEIEGKMAEQEIEKESSASESAEKLYEVQKSKDTEDTTTGGMTNTADGEENTSSTQIGTAHGDNICADA